ncbi:dermonecrotic toxin domain-containing protein [Pseudomonas sp. NFX71]|uniref:dermonecrotic toxin domain-containing protein n=1 Tax=Pseudomonas sp. NFX71 TaxID=3399121 RepID=UPI003A859296
MPTPASPPATASNTDIIARAVRTRFNTRPTLRSQTARMLKDGILGKYSQLAFDPDRTRIAQPIPGGAWRLTPLIDVVLEFLASGTFPDFSEQFGRSCFLTNRAPARLAVNNTTSRLPDLQVIAEVIRELPDILYIGAQESLTDCWNEKDQTGVSRWQWLGDLLAGVLKTSATRLATNNASQAEILMELARQPDKRQRLQRPWAKGAIEACTLQVTLSRGDVTITLQTPDILVICGDTHLLCSVTGDIESFPTRQAFGTAWSARLQQEFMADAITWKRFAPDGNLFDTQAALLLNRQLQDLESLKLPARRSLADLEKQFDAITDVAARFITSENHPTNLQPLQATIPEWLRGAGDTGRMAWRKHTLSMASTQQQTQGRSLRDGVVDLRTFARNALHAQMLKDQPLAPGYKSDELELTFHVPVGDLGSGYLEPVQMSLTDLAINNLAGKPRGRMTIRHTGNQLIQDWTTEAYLLDLVSRVDVGKHYPEYLEAQLLGQNPEARERLRLFGLELSLHLPLRALEHSIKGEHGFSLLGYRYVEALFQPLAAERMVGEQSIVIRPLAFQRRTGGACDVVSNMFIIEPKDLKADGPHILFRPLYPDSLHQYPSRQDLLSAIAQTGPLQTSVLTWLPDRARPVYDNNGFTEPHIVHFHNGDEFSPPEKPEPAILAGDEAVGDWFTALEEGRLLTSLFVSNARALIDLADRQSVSNAESRWAIILEGGWLVFNNVILPLLRGPAMVVGWMLQIAHSLINDLPALDSDDPKARNQAWIDVLLNIGLLVLHVAREQGAPALSDSAATDFPSPLASLRRPSQTFTWPTESTIIEDTPGLPSEPPGSGNTLLDFNLSSARDSASARLFDTLREVQVPWPTPLPVPITTGAFKGLYRIGNTWHATVAGLLFRVSIVPGFGEAYLIHPEHPDHPGIKLKTDGNGHWTLDQGLKLLGGGRNARINAQREMTQQRISLLELNRQEFVDQQARVQKRVDIAENLMQLKKNDPASTELDRATYRQRFVDELDKQTESYATLLAEIRELSELTKSDPDPLQLCSLSENLINNARKRVVITDWEREAVDRQYADLRGGVRHLHEAITREGDGILDRYFEFMRKTAEINETMIKLLEQVDSRLLELKQIPRLGMEYWKRLTGNRPEDEMTALRIKSYQLSVLRLLSLKALGSNTMSVLERTLSPLLLLSRSHAELQTEHTYINSDRIAVLDNLVDQYNKAQDGLETIGIFSTDELQTHPFNRLRELIDQLRVDAERRLAEALQLQPQSEEPSTSASGPRPPVKRPYSWASRKRVINTAKGAFIGDLRQRVANQGGDIVDINDPFEEKPLASFHEHEPNVWVEVVDVRPPTPKAPRPYQQLKGDARKALADTDKHVQKIEGYAQRASSPKEIEEQLQREAQKLIGYADSLEQHESPPANQAPDVSLIDGLREKARNLDTKASELRTRMTLARPPSSEGVEFLLRNNAMVARIIGQRVQLKTGRKDFMQEYVLLNKENQPWWYAHFHYADAEDAKADYTQAHLKTREQRFETYESAMAKAKDPKQQIAIHHGIISKELASRDFLPLQPR